MDNLILKTIIFILKDKETKKPVVVTHFTGFDTDEQANDFSKFLTEEFVQDDDYMKPKRTLH
jgi:predicted phosphohydrolase|tara:strand:- start:921 stop:1106 length:186 start_codon:yes stop_codon:yes gene_type:complete